jgi:hypothetical protein
MKADDQAEKLMPSSRNGIYLIMEMHNQGRFPVDNK